MSCSVFDQYKENGKLNLVVTTNYKYIKIMPVKITEDSVYPVDKIEPFGFELKDGYYRPYVRQFGGEEVEYGASKLDSPYFEAIMEHIISFYTGTEVPTFESFSNDDMVVLVMKGAKNPDSGILRHSLNVLKEI